MPADTFRPPSTLGTCLDHPLVSVDRTRLKPAAVCHQFEHHPGNLTGLNRCFMAAQALGKKNRSPNLLYSTFGDRTIEKHKHHAGWAEADRAGIMTATIRRGGGDVRKQDRNDPLGVEERTPPVHQSRPDDGEQPGDQRLPASTSLRHCRRNRRRKMRRNSSAPPDK